MSGAPGSYWFRGNWDRPDRALLSGGLINGRGYSFQSMVCARGMNTTAEGYPLRWISDFRSGYSDHLPLLLSFEAGKNQ
jgi:hypothetical protein